AKTRASGTGRRSSRIQAQPRPQRRRRIDNGSVVTCRKPSRLASAIADGVAPFRDFPVRRSSCAPLAAASLTRHRPGQKSAAVGTPAAGNWFLGYKGPKAPIALAAYQAGETVLSAASTTGRLLILKEGAVAVVKEGIEIVRASRATRLDAYEREVVLLQWLASLEP